MHGIRLVVPGFGRTEHYQLAAIRCDVPIPKRIVHRPEERDGRPQPGLLRDEGAIIGCVADRERNSLVCRSTREHEISQPLD